MMFEVILSPEAASFFERSQKPLAAKLARCFRNLERDPRRHNNIKRLAGDLKGYLRYRVGDWRVIYQINDENSTVHVAAIAHRSEAYE